MNTQDIFRPWADVLEPLTTHLTMRPDQEYTEVLVHMAGDDALKLVAASAGEFKRLLGDRTNVYWRAAPRIEEIPAVDHFLHSYTIRARALTW